MERFRIPVMRGWVYPLAVWVVLLAVIFAVEYGLMLILPWVIPEQSSRILESVVDAVVLTLLLAPVLWWLIVRPLREIIRLRTQFLVDLFAQIENDRRQTAVELHDGIGQSLTLLISGLRSSKVCRATEECAGQVNSFQRLAENALTEVRRLALGLRPSLLDDLGLAPALERLVADVRAHHPIEISLDIAGLLGVRLPDNVATATFRIVQEALSNIIKHSQARHVAIRIGCAQRNVHLDVSDDGCGIARIQVLALPPGHLGLRGMRERATLLGGDFEIHTAPGRGTSLKITIPTEGVPCG